MRMRTRRRRRRRGGRGGPSTHEETFGQGESTLAAGGAGREARPSPLEAVAGGLALEVEELAVGTGRRGPRAHLVLAPAAMLLLLLLLTA